MAKKRVMKSDGGIAMTEVILFGGSPRTRVGTQYLVTTPRNPDGRLFETVDEAAKFFHVQVSLSGGRRGPRPGAASSLGLRSESA
jgi:hypothetical protein